MKMQSNVNENFEVIKIFIESYLVKHHGFKFGNGILCSGDNYKLIFVLESNLIKLKSLIECEEWISIEIPQNINGQDCVRFAIYAYGEVCNMLRERRL